MDALIEVFLAKNEPRQVACMRHQGAEAVEVARSHQIFEHSDLFKGIRILMGYSASV